MSQSGRYITTSGTGGFVQTLTGDVGAPAVPTAGNINILGGTNINTSSPGGGSDVTVNLDTIVNLPNTNAAGTEGQYQLGGNRFISNFGSQNTFVGQVSGNLTVTGNSNTGIGTTVLQSLTTGSFNSAVGRDCLNSVTTGSSNVAIGTDTGTDITTGSNNIAVGHVALQNLVSGTGNVCVGFEAGQDYNAAESNNIVVGTSVNGTPGESNVIRLGKPGSHTATYIAGILSGSLGGTQALVAIDSTSKLASIGTTVNAVQIGSAAGVVSSIAVGTNGQVLIGATGAAPAFATLTSTGGTIAFTTGANSLNLETSGVSVFTYTAVSTTPYVVASTANYLGVNSSGGARTVQLPNAPTTGKVFIIKDSTGSAATNAITVTTVGGIVLIDGSASFVMNTAYQAISVIFNGTAYEIF